MKLRLNKSRGDLNPLEIRAMEAVVKWVREQKTPIPSKYIIGELMKEGNSKPSAIISIRQLANKGYIRKTVTSSQRSCFYVQLRSVSYE